MPPDLFQLDSSFGDLVRTRRIASGMTQAELAELAGLSVRGLSDLERGVRTRPQRETVQRLQAALAGSPEQQVALQRAARVRTQHVDPPRQEPRNLTPNHVGPLFGRSLETVRLRSWLLEPSPGIVTLTGPGGSGKTRLALALANDAMVLRRFRAGVVFVDLATVREAHQVLLATTAALGWAESSRQSLPVAIAQRLQGQQLCLLLDNFEQVIDAASDLAQLAALLPEVAFLVTSREPLMVRAERCLPVAPLQVPDGVCLSSAETMNYPAVQLFAERARAINPAFALTNSNVREVALLCQRLDGLPLAIELAASLTSTYSPAWLLRRLEQQAPLPGSMRDLPERQRTLAQVVAWSEALLNPAEQAVFQLLGVFDGGFSLDAVRRVWHASDADSTHQGVDFELEQLLGSLVQRSLVQRDDASEDELRFRLLETIRADSVTRLNTNPDRNRVYAAHAAAMLHAAEAAQLWRRDIDFDARLRRLERDLPNLRVTLHWLTEHDLPGALRLLDMLGSFWVLCGSGADGLAYCEAALGLYAEPDLLRCRLLRHAAWIATNLGEFARAKRHIIRAHHLAESLGDERELAFVQFVRGNIAQGLGRMDEAERDIECALRVFQAWGESWATFASNACSARHGGARPR